MGTQRQIDSRKWDIGKNKIHIYSETQRKIDSQKKVGSEKEDTEKSVILGVGKADKSE